MPCWPGWTQSRARSSDWYHDPFVLFGFLAGCPNIPDFSTQVLILTQRQTVLVAKQAACLDVLSGGWFRLGIGIGWNEVEFVGLNETFHNRGRRSEEQGAVMRALWAQPHITFKGRWHTIEDAGISPLPIGRKIPLWYGGHADTTLRRCAKWGGVEFDAEPRPPRHRDHAVAVDRQRLLQQVVAQAVRVLVEFGFEAVRDRGKEVQRGGEQHRAGINWRGMGEPIYNRRMPLPCVGGYALLVEVAA